VGHSPLELAGTQMLQNLDHRLIGLARYRAACTADASVAYHCAAISRKASWLMPACVTKFSSAQSRSESPVAFGEVRQRRQIAGDHCLISCTRSSANVPLCGADAPPITCHPDRMWRCGPPAASALSVVVPPKLRIACLAGPSFHAVSGGVCACAMVPNSVSNTGSVVSTRSINRRLAVPEAKMGMVGDPSNIIVMGSPGRVTLASHPAAP
jgi:hypothetical protein